MNLLAEKIHEFAHKNPQKIALQGDCISLNYLQLCNEISRATALLGLVSDAQAQTFAILFDNHPAWAVLDLALLFNQQCTVPVPQFFSIKQFKHALIDSHAEHLILDESSLDSELMAELEDIILCQESLYLAQQKLIWFRMKKQSSAISEQNFKQKQEIVKITYTSGTTDKPKGVLLSEPVIMAKIRSLAAASEATENDVSLSILPLSTLLENIGGLYVPLYCGASVILLSAKTTGLCGSSQINQQQLLNTIENYKPTAFIIIPQLLLLLVNAITKGYQLPNSLRFIAMGGAPVSKKILQLAENLKIPVYEGYGLSEAVSVIAVNNTSIHRLGSVGKVLESHTVKISDDGEIFVKTDLFSGYLGQKNRNKDEFYATGDLGHFDEQGFLYISGRKKNIINTSFGRNISPEWLEKELEAIPLIAQCVVYGHGKPGLLALLVLRDAVLTQDRNESKKQLQAMINKLNSQLPDYARISDFIICDMPFSVANSQLTGTGRPKRETIYEAYKEQLEQCWDTDTALIKDNKMETVGE